MPKVKRGWPVCRSMPMSPRKMPKTRLVSPRTAELPSTAETVTKASTISEKYSAGPNLSAKSTTTGARKVSPTSRCVPATKEPIAAVASAAPARPRRAIWLPSSAVTMVALSPGRVEQDRRRRAAIHRAVIDAGEQDEGGRRIDLVGDRQQQRDGQRRAEAGQHADRRAERDADDAQRRLIGVSATAKPWARAARVSIRRMLLDRGRLPIEMPSTRSKPT